MMDSGKGVRLSESLLSVKKESDNAGSILIWQGFLPLLAVPLSWWISCRFLSVCDPEKWLIYQWPSYLSCYLPFWAFLFFRYQHHTYLTAQKSYDDEHSQSRLTIPMRGLNAVHAGVLMRLAATAIVLFYWKDEELYKPVYTFLSHIAAFFLFQLASLICLKK